MTSNSPIAIRDIDHVVLRVAELQPMLDFYCNVLGCTVDRRRDELGLVQLRAGRSMVDLVPVDSPLGRAYLEMARRTAARLSLAAAAGSSAPKITVEET